MVPDPLITLAIDREGTMSRIHSVFLKLLFTLGILLCTAITITPANASLVNFNFAGTVDYISPGVSSFNLGQTMWGLITYDNATPDINGLIDTGRYNNAITGGSIHFSNGGYSATLGGPGDNFIEIEKIGTEDVYRLHAPIAGSPLDYFQINIIHRPSAFSNALLPPSLGTISSADFHLVFGSGGPKEVKGPLTTVPLPPAVILFGAGLVALAGMGRLRCRLKAEG
jgi:hypothetical protein